jgi:hypothetical protein
LFSVHDSLKRGAHRHLGLAETRHRHRSNGPSGEDVPCPSSCR